MTPALRFAAALIALAPGAPAMAAAMKLAVNTHFEQGWPRAAFDQVKAAGAAGIRDAVMWGKVETSPGVYAFNDRNSGHVAIACARSIPVLVNVPPRNRLYDGGMAVTSSGARAAFARYVRALVDRFPCIVAVEIGNEINAPSRFWPKPAQLPAAYVAILRDVRRAIDGGDRRVALIGGSSLTIATGFLERLFAAGMLPLVDGVAVHPYADIPEQLPLQFDRLEQAMARHGPVRPVWATEFGLYYRTPEAAPPHAIKLMTVMSAAGVARADWYALRDEKWYPNMGLYVGDRPKPALDMFRLAVRLLGAGDARRIDADDPLTFIYRFGHGPYVMWGGGRPIRFARGAAVSDSRGRPIAPPALLGPDPILVEAPGGYTLAAPAAIADTLFDFGRPPWTILVRTSAGQDRPMRWIDWTWASYMGLAQAPAFKAMPASVTVGAADATPWSLVERHPGAAAQRLWLSACFTPAKAGVAMVRIAQGGRELFAGPADGARQPPLIALAAGESVEISYRPTAKGNPVLLRRRIRLLTSPDRSPPACAPVGAEPPQGPRGPLSEVPRARPAGG